MSEGRAEDESGEASLESMSSGGPQALETGRGAVVHLPSRDSAQALSRGLHLLPDYVCAHFLSPFPLLESSFFPISQSVSQQTFNQLNEQK